MAEAGRNQINSSSNSSPGVPFKDGIKMTSKRWFALNSESVTNTASCDFRLDREHAIRAFECLNLAYPFNAHDRYM